MKYKLSEYKIYSPKEQSLYDYLAYRYEDFVKSFYLTENSVIEEIDFSISRTRIFKLCGTDCAIFIERDYLRTLDNSLILGDCISIKEDWFKDRKIFGRGCRKIAEKLNVPTEIVLALGGNEDYVLEFLDLINKLKVFDVNIIKKIIKELSCGIDRRNNMLNDLAIKLTDNHNFSKMLSSLGQLNSYRLSNYIIVKLEKLL